MFNRTLTPISCIYFASVAEAGDDGWKEEMDRMRGRLKHMPPDERGDPMNVHAIRAMLPTWRAWGEVVDGI